MAFLHLFASLLTIAMCKQLQGGKLRKLRLAGSLVTTMPTPQFYTNLHLDSSSAPENFRTLSPPFRTFDPCVHLEFHAKYASCIYLSVHG